METSTEKDVIQQAENLISLDAICYNEDLEEVKTLQVLGNHPNVEVNLSDIHYLTLAFNSTTEVATKYTERELSTLIAGMKPYVGVKLEFMKGSKVDRTNYSPCNLNMINVYKYDAVNISLCSWSEMSQYFGRITDDLLSINDKFDNDNSSSEMSCSDVSSESESEEDEDEGVEGDEGEEEEGEEDEGYASYD